MGENSGTNVKCAGLVRVTLAVPLALKRICKYLWDFGGVVRQPGVIPSVMPDSRPDLHFLTRHSYVTHTAAPRHTTPRRPHNGLFT